MNIACFIIKVYIKPEINWRRLYTNITISITDIFRIELLLYFNPNIVFAANEEADSTLWECQEGDTFWGHPQKFITSCLK